MRTASPTLLFVVSLVIALVGAWGAHQQEARIRRAQPASSSRCLALLESLQASDPSNSARGARALRLREHIDECRADPLYVEQLIRELLENGTLIEAKSIFETAQREHVFAPDEATAVEAWIALAEVRMAYAEDRTADAARALDEANQRATRLAHTWPEWAVPAQLLMEVDRAIDAAAGEAVPDRLDQLQRARRSIRTGAFVRTLPPLLYPLFIAGLVLVATWSMLSGIRQWLDLRARVDLPASTIADAMRNTTSGSGPVEVAVSGTLALRPGARELVAPFSKKSCLWFDRVLNYTNAKARSRLTSSDLFVVTDASGALIINPAGFRVDTHHSNVTMGQSRLGYKRVKPTIEDRLHVRDRVYVRGTLSSDASENLSSTWHLTAGRLELSILTNIELPTLRATSARWMAIGVGIACIALVFAFWSMQQRAIPSVPGVLT